MGSQFIFVVETNKACNSDWIYIKDTIENFYKYERTQVKFSVVYMSGKGNYNTKKTEKDINKYISQYSVTAKGNHSNVIFCFDCDEYNNKADDAKFLEDARRFCADKEYDFVWFCKDVEQVYIGKKVDNSQKKKEAAKFKEKKLINKVDTKHLCMDEYKIKTSNIMCILDKYQELERIK